MTDVLVIKSPAAYIDYLQQEPDKRPKRVVVESLLTRKEFMAKVREELEKRSSGLP